MEPSLFGINHSNRDFTQKESWGKNCFNSSFPTALCSYLYDRELELVYLRLNSNLEVEHSFLNTAALYRIDPKSDNLFYAFEVQFTPYQPYLIGTLPNVDLVTQIKEGGFCLSPLEIKLTALPDNTTCDLSEELYGSELVIRPDTIAYLACSILDGNQSLPIIDILNTSNKVSDWTEGNNVLDSISQIIKIIDEVCALNLEVQKPLLLQPVWKTEGKSPKLSENCLDVFVWSNLAFTRLFIDSVKLEIERNKEVKSIGRHARTIIWLFKMIADFIKSNKFNHAQIIDQLSYNTKNDKAFAVSGTFTHSYMKSEYLKWPRIKRQEIKNIILGGGQNLLSPERRFDAIIFNSPDLFH